MRIHDYCWVPARSMVERTVLAGDPLGQRGALVAYGHLMVPGVSVFVRYPRILSLACAAIDLSDGSADRRRASEALFMWAWRSVLGEEDKSFYTRGQNMEGVFRNIRTTPHYRDLHRQYVKNTFTDQIGYSLKGLGLIVEGKLTPIGKELADTLLKNNIRGAIEAWLMGDRLSISFIEKLKQDRFLPSRVFADERDILKRCVFDDGTHDAAWRREIRSVVRRWREESDKWKRAPQCFAHEISGAKTSTSVFVRHIAAYEELRAEAVSCLALLISQARQGVSVPVLYRQAHKRLKILARRVDCSLPQTHPRAKAIVSACLSQRVAIELCALANGICAVDRNSGKVTILDQERASRIADSYDGEDKYDPHVYEYRSYRTYQIWNLWQLNRHLEDV